MADALTMLADTRLGQKQLLMAVSADGALFKHSRVLGRKRRPTQSVMRRSLKAACVPAICD